MPLLWPMDVLSLGAILRGGKKEEACHCWHGREANRQKQRL